MACLDLDSFKPVNDAFGHAAGDELLCESRRINQRNPQSPTWSRLGGDELALVADHDRPGMNTLPYRELVRIVGRPIVCSRCTQKSTSTSASASVSHHPDHSDQGT